MFDGFYKSEFSVDERAGQSVTLIRAGKLLGGNSAFAHVGTYSENAGEVRMDLTSTRHLEDQVHQSLLGKDVSHVSLMGRIRNNAYHFLGSSPQMPGATIRSVVTPIDESELPLPGHVAENGIRNGLYSIHFRLLDGLKGGLTGIALLNDGQILGGDASFFYLGSYSSSDGRWKGEILSQVHTSAPTINFPFRRTDVGIGFSGIYGDGSAVLSAVAFSGKRSFRMEANLRLIEGA